MSDTILYYSRGDINGHGDWSTNEDHAVAFTSESQASHFSKSQRLNSIPLEIYSNADDYDFYATIWVLAKPLENSKPKKEKPAMSRTYRTYRPGEAPAEHEYKSSHRESKSARRRRNRQANQQQNQQFVQPGLERLDSKNEPKKSAMDAIGNLIYGSSSHKGPFWIGVSVSTVSLILNTRFYTGVGTGFFGWPLIFAGIAGLGFAVVTTILEAAPLIKKKSYKHTLHTIFLVASRPSRLPQVKNTQHHNPGQLHRDYANSQKEFEKFCALMRWVCISIEVLAGLAGLSGSGTGQEAVAEFLLFIFSIFGAVYGLVAAMKAYDMQLSPSVRKQFDDITSQDKPLQL
jgi:hypothetical protein